MKYEYKQFTMEAVAINSYTRVVGVSSQANFHQEADTFDDLFQNFKKYLDNLMKEPDDLIVIQKELTFCTWNLENAHKEYVYRLKKHGYSPIIDGESNCYAVYSCYINDFCNDKSKVPDWAIRPISHEIYRAFEW